MKKKIFKVVLIITIFVIFGFLALLFLGFFKEQSAGILVEADPVSTVFIDEQEVGKTPYEASRDAGEIILRIKPDSVEGVVLDDYETKIKLVPGIRTVVKRIFRETEEYSSGVTVSFEKLGSLESYVTVVSVPDNAQVSINGKISGYTPLRLKVPAGDHTLVVSSNNYFEKSLPIRVYAGYKLTASVKLGKMRQQEESSRVTTTSETSSSTSLGKIKINKTDTGFLRVRSGANIGFPEIARVYEGEEYDLLDEGENGDWYKIRIINAQGDVIDGWVSAEFTTKLIP